MKRTPRQSERSGTRAHCDRCGREIDTKNVSLQDVLPRMSEQDSEQGDQWGLARRSRELNGAVEHPRNWMQAAAAAASEIDNDDDDDDGGGADQFAGPSASFRLAAATTSGLAGNRDPPATKAPDDDDAAGA